MMDYVDEPTEASDSASTAQTGDDPASTGDDPALLKLVRKLEVCDAVEDAEERRKFVAKHANSVGMSVDDVLRRLHARGTLSAEEVSAKLITTFAKLLLMHTFHSVSHITPAHAGARLGRQRQGARHRALA